MKVRSSSLERYSNDVCGLCGSTPLTKTHIPARAAGNQGRARKGIEVEDPSGATILQLSRPTEGGGWGRWLCGRCNTSSGVWDDEYGEWARNLVAHLHDALSFPSYFSASVAMGRPGAVVRSMWAWMFALIPDLRTRYPDLAQAVISGDPVRSPDDLGLLLGATSSLRIWVCGQSGGFAVRGRLDGRDGHQSPSGLWTPGPEMVAVPRIAVCSPPFVVLLADSGDDVRANYFDTREWLEEDARSVRPVSLLLPMVRAFDADGPVTLVTYEELASAA